MHRALEENMLVPFHYYGVSDIEVEIEVEVDGKLKRQSVLLDDKADFNKLVCTERVGKS